MKVSRKWELRTVGEPPLFYPMFTNREAALVKAHRRTGKKATYCGVVVVGQWPQEKEKRMAESTVGKAEGASRCRANSSC